jgi:hypothetical protein
MIPGIGRENVRAGPVATVPPVRWRSGLLAGVLVGVGAVLLPGVAAASTPTVSESFSAASIPLNDTGTLTFTIDNSADTSVHAVGFDDHLPTGIQVDGNPSASSGCIGLPTTGLSDLSFTGSVAPQGICTVSVGVEGVQDGAWDNPATVTIDLSSSINTDASVDVVAPPSISAAFGTSLLGLDGTTPVTFTIANPNPGFALSGLAFTDQLPGGLVVVGSPGDTCGGAVTAVAGTNSLGLSDGQLSPGSSCTVSVTVVAIATGALSNTTTQVSSVEGGIGNSASAGVTVIGPPTVALSSPVASYEYAFGQQVRASYSCTDDPSGPGIASCAGDIPSGSLINTSKPGVYTFTVTAISKDGGIATDIVFYSVAPDNRFTVAKPRVHSAGSIDLALKVPGPGRITVLEKASGLRGVFARGSATARRAGTVRLTINPGAAGRRDLRRRHSLRLTVTVGYTPTGGTQRTTSLKLNLA